MTTSTETEARVRPHPHLNGISFTTTDSATGSGAGGAAGWRCRVSRTGPKDLLTVLAPARGEDSKTAIGRSLRKIPAILMCAVGVCMMAIDVAAAQAPTNRGLEEVVVTARKISESIQDVPVAIQAFTGTSLAERGLTDIAEIGNSVSNMEFDSLSPISGSSNTPNINIRGIGTTDFLLTIDPSVGVYVDGVYVARSVGGLFDLLDIEQVEVLKGAARDSVRP